MALPYNLSLRRRPESFFFFTLGVSIVLHSIVFNYPSPTNDKHVWSWQQKPQGERLSFVEAAPTADFPIAKSQVPLTHARNSTCPSGAVSLTLGDIIANGNQPPVYPEQAKRWGWEGRTLIKLTTDPTGKVENAEVIESSGYAILDEAALSAASTWTLADNGKGHSYLLPIVFKLNDGSR